MYVMTLIEDGIETGLIQRPLQVATEEEAIVLGEEAVKRYIGKDNIVFVPASCGGFDVVEVIRTSFLTTLRKI